MFTKETLDTLVTYTENRVRAEIAKGIRKEWRNAEKSGTRTAMLKLATKLNKK